MQYLCVVYRPDGQPTHKDGACDLHCVYIAHFCGSVWAMKTDPVWLDSTTFMQACGCIAIINGPQEVKEISLISKE